MQAEFGHGGIGNWELGLYAPEGGLRLRQAQDKIGHGAWGIGKRVRV